jgi:Nucleoside-diphosphate-sugar pyrophosphorylase involved in lipopolysaccharide biosynthesis/translation initiation factor 2B, gamma/epsilon subunits (eIF-2Bgamma/eIF-2Bepsilon)
MMEAVILAGGMGTRLHDAVPGLPKPMAPVNGKPFLWHLLSWLTEYPVSKIILSTGYKYESIINYFGDTFQGVPVEYTIEKEPLGTGGGLMLATEKVNGSDFIVINGDTYFPVNLAEIYLFHTVQSAFITVALKKMQDFSRYGAVECINGRIIQFHEKKFCHDGFINGGIYVMNRNMLISRHLPEIFSLEKDILEKSAGTGDLRGMVFTEPFLDIGIAEEYNRAVDVLRKEKEG